MNDSSGRRGLMDPAFCGEWCRFHGDPPHAVHESGRSTSPRGVPTMAMIEAATEAWNRAEDKPGGRGPIVGSSYVTTISEMLGAALAVLLNDGYTLVPPPQDCVSCGQRPPNHRLSCPIGGPI